MHLDIIEPDPLNVTNYENLAGQEVRLNRLEQAELHARKAMDLAPPGSIRGLFVLGLVQLRRRDFAAARDTLSRLADRSGAGDRLRLFTSAVVEFCAGNETASRAGMLEYEQRYGSDDRMSLAEIHAWRGDMDAAFANLDRALAAHHPLIGQIKGNFFLMSLHGDPRWTALKRKIGLPTD